MENKLTKKLKLQAGEKNLLLQAQDSFIQTVQEIPFHTTPIEEGYDYVQLFVQSQEKLNSHVPAALEAVKEDGKSGSAIRKKRRVFKQTSTAIKAGSWCKKPAMQE